MTGPEHYREAELHLVDAAGIETDGHEDSKSAWHQRQAQAHATLALAAATALIDETPHPASFGAYREWQKVIGPEAAEVTRLCGPT